MSRPGQPKGQTVGAHSKGLSPDGARYSGCPGEGLFQRNIWDGGRCRKVAAQARQKRKLERHDKKEEVVFL